jgi:hypothetical protein
MQANAISLATVSILNEKIINNKLPISISNQAKQLGRALQLF